MKGISEIRTYFRTNEQPVYFIGPTAFNLLGIDRWVRNFYYIAYYDSWDGAHPRVFSPTNKPYVEFESSEEINNYLLRDPEVQAFIERGAAASRPKVAMVFFDEETEEICEELGYELILPHRRAAPAPRLQDRHHAARQRGRRAASVPNVLGQADTYAELTAAGRRCRPRHRPGRADAVRRLGQDDVLHHRPRPTGTATPRTSSAEELKIMKRIRNKAAAVEAVITRHGTIVGPFMTDLTGYPELTPYKGGWCGNDLLPGGAVRRRSGRRRSSTSGGSATGSAQEGYKGFFEVDVLVDLDSDEVYLGELNPRISGASSMTNVTAGAYADVPLFLFHLLEWMDVDYTIDVDEINERWRQLAAVDVWAQLIMKEPDRRGRAAPGRPADRHLHAATRTARLTFSRVATDWHQLTHEDECFFLRVYGPGDYRFKGADLGILVTKGRMQTDAGLTERCRSYIDGIRSAVLGEPASPGPTSSRSPTSSTALTQSERKESLMADKRSSTTSSTARSVPAASGATTDVVNPDTGEVYAPRRTVRRGGRRPRLPGGGRGVRELALTSTPERAPARPAQARRR